MSWTTSLLFVGERYVFSVLPASRCQGLVVSRIGEWLLRSCAIASFPPAGCRQHAKHIRGEGGGEGERSSQLN